MKSLRSYFYRAASRFGMDLDSALWVAVMRGQAGRVRILVEAGAGVCGGDDAALGVAAESGHTDTVGVLLEAGANVQAWDDRALRWAAAKGRTETVKLLLERGANLHVWDDAPLRVAAVRGHTETVKLLREAGADVHAKHGEALANGHNETAAVLKKWMAGEGRSPEKGGNDATGPEIAPPGP